MVTSTPGIEHGRRLHPVRRAGLALLVAAQSACAVRYYDSRTQTEHVWGFGHLRQRVLAGGEGARAVVTGTTVVGVYAGKDGEGFSFGAGAETRRRIVVADNHALALAWPASGWFDVRLGSSFPVALLPPPVPPAPLASRPPSPPAGSSPP